MEILYFFIIIGLVVICSSYITSFLLRLEKRIDFLSNVLIETKILIENGRLKLFTTGSPLILTEKGNQVLEESGLKKYIEGRKFFVIEACKNNGALKPEDMEMFIFDFFNHVNFKEPFNSEIKKYSYNSVISLHLLGRVGAIYTINICFEKLDNIV
ncbi:MAG: hypothetical protein COV57_02605 [Candidatus Liptonbacteria bacterium CG11_big_fil_rev_8_21_14_0_20_35_14]|uniref:Uncharacterized protein n=1 Tax=Candidatus Liptonbacteria bacterium CG11_big_fil_rev_8_21_14_0_20_35_14 TaxID=1974634 RepID=A0A2H0N7B1_9BACT|nr:MAG: hypothetical protein COV57_02605 [Candidatus Liptonbacteria bacterium CG11_big_fil_rev_8_21_14_0_20_35_14]